jgi:hypothetical protein
VTHGVLATELALSIGGDRSGSADFIDRVSTGCRACRRQAADVHEASELWCVLPSERRESSGSVDVDTEKFFASSCRNESGDVIHDVHIPNRSCHRLIVVETSLHELRRSIRKQSGRLGLRSNETDYVGVSCQQSVDQV